MAEHKENYLNHVSDDIIIDDITAYLYINREFPLIKNKYVTDFDIREPVFRSKSNVGFISLVPYDDIKNSFYHKKNLSEIEKRSTSGLDLYEQHIYRFEHMLGEYKSKLNKVELTSLGDPNKSLDVSKKDYYQNFFNNEVDIAIANYLDGLQWVLDYYYNDIVYDKWYYLYNKSPLLSDVLTYLKTKNNSNIFLESKDRLNKLFLASRPHKLTPFEQLLYVTPFNKEGTHLDLFSDYSTMVKKNVDNILTEAFTSETFLNLYPNIKEIAQRIYSNNTNTDIDCRDAIFLNKCILNSVNDSNVIDETEFKNIVRKNIPVEEQVVRIKKIESSRSLKRLYSKYNKYRKLFMTTGKIKHKRKYKKMKVILAYYI